MPTIHAQLQGNQQQPDGTVIQVSPSQALQLRGPIFQVSLSVESNIGQGLVAQGQALPAPVTGWGLFDTGATGTCIDVEVAKDLGLPVIDVAKMHSATHEDEPCNIYPVQLTIQPNISIGVARAMGAKLKSQGIIALIGRDVMSHGILVYSGVSGSFSFSI